MHPNEIINQLKAHQLWIDTLGKRGNKLRADEIDFREVDLSKFSLDQAYMTDCIFDGMDLKNKDMSSSIVCSSTFISANVQYADFYKANLSYANLTNVNAQNARFAKSDCIETVFYKADLRNTTLVGALFDVADFREANFQNADVSLSTFEGVLFQGAQLSGIKGLNEAFIQSINIGTPENPLLLYEQDAKEWLLRQSSNE
ncbi:pentapeptide repeat-containing protein [Paenibacillus dendritiformis]|uniref:pentapeptide repeat-containing protein n=1 Tax=Paenibacillus dendritiformis TaxID=130049 RepID=UPI000DA747D8|nr:pentapeptide repeat-containing protein [Paenibacillus dendritiformis]PZM63160.1 pentapeptide repeat-containing protein [Paenibacillus dendritiformis]